ncbi:MAG TPA: 16S rRNA (guanine(966)-N(2))-methyltransferase RsmD [Candidatus Polarisedimenticolia bacterium]|nr:16S rRNA (guanine(966)-N(2))-methyltransferase RsmD [Candidatus Polarisedimenticolia bacterium]
MGSGRGALRVIGGSLRGRRLLTPRGDRIRPTGDRVREALFDILGDRIRGAVFLDAYAGTGAVGVEALSRGAGFAVFVERDPEAVELIRRNLDSLRESAGRARLIGRDLAAAVALLETEGVRFDVVYLDPPWSGGELDRGLRLIGTGRILSHAAVVVAEHDAASEPPGGGALKLLRTRSYGRAGLTFYAATHR